MKITLFILFIALFLIDCGQKNKNVNFRPNYTPEFLIDSTDYDFTMKDTLGNRLTFHQVKDSIFYDYFRFRPVNDTLNKLIPQFNLLTEMWKKASTHLDIRLRSFNVGYPIEYDDILDRHINAFIQKPIDLHSADTQHTTYQMISQTMFEQKVYPMDHLLSSFGYHTTSISIEKVGYVLPAKLKTLGYDTLLKIPVPYMVWINVEKTH